MTSCKTSHSTRSGHPTAEAIAWLDAPGAPALTTHAALRAWLRSLGRTERSAGGASSALERDPEAHAGSVRRHRITSGLALRNSRSRRSRYRDSIRGCAFAGRDRRCQSHSRGANDRRPRPATLRCRHGGNPRRSRRRRYGAFTAQTLYLTLRDQRVGRRLPRRCHATSWRQRCSTRCVAYRCADDARADCLGCHHDSVRGAAR